MQQHAVHTLMEECPTCGTPLSRIKFNEIQAKVRLEEEQRARRAKAEVERMMVDAQKKLAADRQVLDARAKADQEALDKAKAAIEKMKVDRALLEKTAKEATDQAVAKALNEKEAEAAKKAEAGKKLAQAELNKQRELLTADFNKKMLHKDAEANRANEAAQKKLLELQRKLDARPANELGEGAEVDVFESLKAAFDSKGDSVVRVAKGQPGPDIIHTVMHNGAACGKIIYDSKNRLNWAKDYATKLCSDKVNASADFAILATTTFPKDKKELSTMEGVVLVNPARVVELVRIVRRSLVQLHIAKLSNDQRAEKQNRLYQYINSEACREKFIEAGRLAENLLGIDVEEEQVHTRVWKKRGSLLRKMQNVVDDVETEINGIVSGSAGG